MRVRDYGSGIQFSKQSINNRLLWRVHVQCGDASPDRSENVSDGKKMGRDGKGGGVGGHAQCAAAQASSSDIESSRAILALCDLVTGADGTSGNSTAAAAAGAAGSEGSSSPCSFSSSASRSSSCSMSTAPANGWAIASANSFAWSSCSAMLSMRSETLSRSRSMLDFLSVLFACPSTLTTSAFMPAFSIAVRCASSLVRTPSILANSVSYIFFLLSAASATRLFLVPASRAVAISSSIFFSKWDCFLTSISSISLSCPIASSDDRDCDFRFLLLKTLRSIDDIDFRRPPMAK
ncbi:hypothetical protein PENTCL1PPCAC_7245 [Pristionchus entomophagus]|uniref:Uncharacterized protein n=1 Tax=Pristionchus entomophagus TaxID=358040 RepID=A0AAV5SPX6_9BILA|nr:hypothetical protein PENTCL1PPCAC_7245 [Pristionchus entomophagus]